MIQVDEKQSVERVQAHGLLSAKFELFRSKATRDERPENSIRKPHTKNSQLNMPILSVKKSYASKKPVSYRNTDVFCLLSLIKRVLGQLM